MLECLYLRLLCVGGRGYRRVLNVESCTRQAVGRSVLNFLMLQTEEMLGGASGMPDTSQHLLQLQLLTGACKAYKTYYNVYNVVLTLASLHLQSD